MDRLHVLIIEDDIDTANCYNQMLSMLGHDSEIVLSAKAALTRLAGSVPHLILLDLNLRSDVDGEIILYQIRSNPRLDRTRVIVITAFPMMTQMITNLADLILIKPISFDQLKDLVSRVTLPEYHTKRLSFRDPVTGLFNREFLHTRLEHAYERAKRRPDFLYAAAVFALYGEDRKKVEAQQETWNRLLREVTDRVLRQLRPTDTLTRLSGWKFAALVEELKMRNDIQIVIQRLKDSILEPYVVDDEQYVFNVTFGAAVYTSDLQKPRELLKQAEDLLTLS